ncbi:MAG: hypothetical protein IJI43_03630 [Bacilli bacterium]|nr:hypothetical protein [Bacilli bacterium]
MKISDYSFREIDKRIIKLEDKELIKDMSLSIPYYGIIYIDHLKGISLRIIGDDNTSLIMGEGYILRYEDIKDIEVNFSDYKDRDLVYKWVDSYYTDRDILHTRKITEIDIFRLPSNPDIVEVKIEDKKIWARIVGYKDDLLVCAILSDVKKYNLTRGTTIAVDREMVVQGRIDL